jgi:hypothetical protein
MAPGQLSALQQAFLETGGAQCGICTPGMLMAGQAYLDAGGGPGRRGHPRGDRRQPVPLHRLHQDHRRDRARHGLVSTVPARPSGMSRLAARGAGDGLEPCARDVDVDARSVTSC